MARSRNVALTAHLGDHAIDGRGVAAIDGVVRAGSAEHPRGAAPDAGRATRDEYAIAGHIQGVRFISAQTARTRWNVASDVARGSSENIVGRKLE